MQKGLNTDNRISKKEVSQDGKTYHDALTGEEIAYNKSETGLYLFCNKYAENDIETLYNENTVKLGRNTSYSYDVNGNQFSSVESTVSPITVTATMNLIFLMRSIG